MIYWAKSRVGWLSFGVLGVESMCRYGVESGAVKMNRDSWDLRSNGRLTVTRIGFACQLVNRACDVNFDLADDGGLHWKNPNPLFLTSTFFFLASTLFAKFPAQWNGLFPSPHSPANKRQFT